MSGRSAPPATCRYHFRNRRRPAGETGDGNTSSQSVGVVQVGPATVTRPTSWRTHPPATRSPDGRPSEPGRQPCVAVGWRRPGRRRQLGDQSLGAVQVSSSKGALDGAVEDTAGTTQMRASPARSELLGRLGRHGAARQRQRRTGTTGAIQINPTTAAHLRSRDGPARARRTIAVSGNEVLGDTLGVDLSELGLAAGPGDRARPRRRRLARASRRRVGRRVSSSSTRACSRSARTATTYDRPRRADRPGRLADREPAVSLSVLGTTSTSARVAGVPNTGVPVSTTRSAVAQAGGGNRRRRLDRRCAGRLVPLRPDVPAP